MNVALHAWNESGQLTPEDEVMRAELRETVDRCFAGMPSRMVTMLCHSFGLGDSRELSAAECAEGLGVTAQYVHVTLREGMRKLRRPARRNALARHMDGDEPDVERHMRRATINWDQVMHNACLLPIAFHACNSWRAMPFAGAELSENDRRSFYNRTEPKVPRLEHIPRLHRFSVLGVPGKAFAKSLMDEQVALVEGVARRGVHFQDAAHHVRYVAIDRYIDKWHRIAAVSYLTDRWFEWIEWYVVKDGQKRLAGRLECSRAGSGQGSGE